MDQRTLKALHGSIKKWEAIVAGTGVDDGIHNCPLCVLFWRNNCAGCPVAESSNDISCNNTPYKTAWTQAVDPYGSVVLPFSAKTTQQKAAAKEELSFLKSLLPKDLPDTNPVPPSGDPGPSAQIGHAFTDTLVRKLRQLRGYAAVIKAKLFFFEP
jgi:hypothetical protein